MNKFLQYDSVDFAQEDSFVRWIKEDNTEDEAFWLEWINNNPSKKEEFEKAKILVKQIAFKNDTIKKETEERVWSKINASVTNKSDTQTIKSNSSRAKVIRLASIAAVAAMAIFFLMVGVGNNYDTQIKTQFAEMQSIELPDGSIAYLNADSHLKYDKDTWEKERTLNLEGEAFFEVKKGSQFMVNTKKGNVTVLGTSFNVYQRNRDFKVYCKTGKVSVFAAKNTTILMPNQSVSIPKQIHEIEKSNSSSQNRSNWRDGIYTYTNESIEEVVKELERQLDVKISIPEELKNQKYTGGFNANIQENALSEVFWPLDMVIESNGREIVIKKKVTE